MAETGRAVAAGTCLSDLTYWTPSLGEGIFVSREVCDGPGGQGDVNLMNVLGVGAG